MHENHKIKLENTLTTTVTPYQALQKGSVLQALKRHTDRTHQTAVVLVEDLKRRRLSCLLRQEIHSVVVLLGLSFFGYIWGFTGHLLSKLLVQQL